MLHIFLLSIIHEVFTKQIFDAAIMKHAVKSKWFNINPDDLDIAVYESQKIHGMSHAVWHRDLTSDLTSLFKF